MQQPEAQTGPRPLTRRGTTTRSRIVEAAAALVQQHGAAGTSLDAVIAAAGVSKSQLYHYFADKEALVTAVVAHQAERVLAMNGPLLANLASVEDLESWAHVLIEGTPAGEAGCPLGSLVGELAGRPAPRAALAEGFARWRGFLAEGFARMQRSGRLSDAADPEDLAIMCLAALQGGLLLAQAEGSTRPLRLALAMAIARVAAGAPAPAPAPGRG